MRSYGENAIHDVISRERASITRRSSPTSKYFQRQSARREPRNRSLQRNRLRIYLPRNDPREKIKESLSRGRYSWHPYAIRYGFIDEVVGPIYYRYFHSAVLKFSTHHVFLFIWQRVLIKGRCDKFDRWDGFEMKFFWRLHTQLSILLPCRTKISNVSSVPFKMTNTFD